jgi:hypothetical protein
MPPSECDALVARERELDLRRVINMFQLLRQRWGKLTAMQIRRMSRLLDGGADALYRHADRVERGDAAPRILKKHAVSVLAAGVARVGYNDDPVTQAVLADLAELTEDIAKQPSATPRVLRHAAQDLVRLSKVVANARSLPRRVAPRSPRGGRYPNVPLERLLYFAAKHGYADIEVACGLAREKIHPDGLGSARQPKFPKNEQAAEESLAQRWAVIIRSARTRQRRREANAKKSRRR